MTPPLFRLLWKLGLEVPPPLFLPFWVDVLLPGGFFAVFWGLFMMSWEAWCLGRMPSLLLWVPTALAAGFFLG